MPISACATCWRGACARRGARVRITAQLVDGTSGGQLWAERYDRDLADIFAVQDDVTQKIVAALEVQLAPGESGPRVETSVPEAYDLVLRAREQYRLFSDAGHARAQGLFREAVALDPDYAAPYAGLAQCQQHAWLRGESDALEKGLELALKARALNADAPQVFEALGNIQLFRRHHDEAVAAARRWVEIEPGSADALANLAGALHFAGEPHEALPLIDRAMRFNPFYPFYYMLYRGQCHFVMERYEEALASIERSARQNPEVVHTFAFLASCLGHLGRHEEAEAALEKARELLPTFSAEWISMVPYKRERDLDRLLAGLKLAGLET